MGSPSDIPIYKFLYDVEHKHLVSYHMYACLPRVIMAKESLPHMDNVSHGCVRKFNNWVKQGVPGQTGIGNKYAVKIYIPELDARFYLVYKDAVYYVCAGIDSRQSCGTFIFNKELHTQCETSLKGH